MRDPKGNESCDAGVLVLPRHVPCASTEVEIAIRLAHRSGYLLQYSRTSPTEFPLGPVTVSVAGVSTYVVLPFTATNPVPLRVGNSISNDAPSLLRAPR